MSLRAQIKIDVILHATENIDRIFKSFFDNFGLERDDFQIQNLIGHFDNPITLLSINLKKKNAESFITNLIGIISRPDLDKIYESIEENISSSGLKLKISKQKMIEGKIILENSDAIKINVSCPVYIKKDSKKVYQQLFQLGK
tara:strand:+ start:70 stop:498 length:429 start_codon:yes stop_codon:yes gene_type:complete